MGPERTPEEAALKGTIRTEELHTHSLGGTPAVHLPVLEIRQTSSMT